MFWVHFLGNAKTYLKQAPLATKTMNELLLGGIQQLRGQEEGEGGSAKSPRLSTQGGGGPLNVHVDQNLACSESISYHCAL